MHTLLVANAKRALISLLWEFNVAHDARPALSSFFISSTYELSQLSLWLYVLWPCTLPEFRWLGAAVLANTDFPVVAVVDAHPLGGQPRHAPGGTGSALCCGYVPTLLLNTSPMLIISLVLAILNNVYYCLVA